MPRGQRTPVDPDSLEGKLKTCMADAKRVDKMRARAKTLTEKALAAKKAADELDESVRERIRELTRGRV